MVANFSDCKAPADTDPCALSISHRRLGESAHFNQYNTWILGDDKLDWWTGQPQQMAFEGISAMGTPMVWSTDDPEDQAYHSLNK